MSLDPTDLIAQPFGEFHLEELVGSSPYAWVFRATTAKTGEHVAIKVLRPQYSGEPHLEQRFRREFETAARLKHPNIVEIEAVGKHRNLTFYAMHFYPDSLASRLDREGPMLEPDLVTMAMDLAKGLSFAHETGIVHRDIKPDNVLFDVEGQAVLADFGIARAISNAMTVTGENMTIGTPQFLSPEQAQGKPLDGRSDLYSLGVTLYRAATGVVPFRSTDWFELARMHVEKAPAKPRNHRDGLSTRIERVILKLLEKAPEHRYQTADELLADLAQLSNAERPTATFGAYRVTESMVKPPKRQRRGMKVFGAVAIVLLVAWLVVLLGTR